MPGIRQCDHSAVVADAKSGMKYIDIAKKYNISEKSVSRIALRAGIHRAIRPIGSVEADFAEGDAWEDRFRAEWREATGLVLRGLGYGKSRKTAAGKAEQADREGSGLCVR